MYQKQEVYENIAMFGFTILYQYFIALHWIKKKKILPIPNQIFLGPDVSKLRTHKKVAYAVFYAHF